MNIKMEVTLKEEVTRSRLYYYGSVSRILFSFQPRSLVKKENVAGVFVTVINRLS